MLPSLPMSGTEVTILLHLKRFAERRVRNLARDTNLTPEDFIVELVERAVCDGGPARIKNPQLPLYLQNALLIEADNRGVQPETLIAALLTHIVRDNLFAAVLDVD